MDAKPLRVLILMAGPKFDLEWEFGLRLKGLSAFSEGSLITTGQPERELRIGNYHVCATYYWPESLWSRLRSRLEYLRRCLQVMRLAKRQGRPIELIVTYDPLLTGATGLVLASLFGARLICEVNGDYGDEVNFRHVKWSWLRRAKRAIAIRLARFVLKRSSGARVLYPGQLTRLGYKPKRDQVIVHIPEFVDTTAFKNETDEPTVLLVGFPFLVKGVDIAVAAFKRASVDHPAWKLVIMGYYPDAGELESAIGDCTHIVHQQPVLHREMPRYIGRCGILLQPSRTEAMGRVLVEGMAAGKPRIASNVGGIPTVVSNETDGILVQSEDVEGFANALSRLMGSEELRQQFGRAGAARAAREFSPENYFARLELFYRDVAGAGHSG